MSVPTFTHTTKTGKTISLVNGDCLTEMGGLPESSVDVVVTSPPYNLGIKYSGYDDTISREAYLKWTNNWADAVKRVLAPEGSFFLNVGAKPTDPMVPFQILQVMAEQFVLQNTLHWVKSIAIMKSEVGDYPGVTGNVVVGHYKPISSKRFVNDCHEYIFHLTHQGMTPMDRLAIGVPYQDKTNITRWKGSSRGLHCRGNTWFIPYHTILNRSKDRPHPATFPVELPKRCILLHRKESIRTVMDPFLGIGSTAMACKDLDVNFIGFEISKEYYDYACERLSGYSPADIHRSDVLPLY